MAKIKNSKLHLLDEIKSPTRKLANSIAFDDGWECDMFNEYYYSNKKYSLVNNLLDIEVTVQRVHHSEYTATGYCNRYVKFEVNVGYETTPYENYLLEKAVGLRISLAEKKHRKVYNLKQKHLQIASSARDRVARRSLERKLNSQLTTYTK